RKENIVIESPEAGYATYPRHWIGFGSKCFYFSELTNNWTSSQTFSMELGAHITHFDSLEELIQEILSPGSACTESHQSTPVCGQTTLNITTCFPSEEKENMPTSVTLESAVAGTTYLGSEFVASPATILYSVQVFNSFFRECVNVIMRDL
ncbi:hypothetical protein U0070_002895, partial [Myodes glareolus]